MQGFVGFTGMFIGLFLILGLPVLGIFWAIRADEKARLQRDKRLKKLFGDDIKIYHTFPIPHAIEEVVQGGLHVIIQRFRELIVTDSWIFIQPTYRWWGKITTREHRNAAVLSLFARKLDGFSPTFLIRNRHNTSFLSRYYQAQIKDRQLVRSELDFDNEQNLYIEQGKQIQALQILSPELLITLENAPGSADIIIRKNQLYYILPGEQPAEEIVNQLFLHSTKVMKELEDNLMRWARAESNKAEVEAIKNMDLAMTLGEMWQLSQND